MSLSDFERVARAHIASRLSKHTRSAYTDDFDRWLKFCEQSKYDATDPPEEAGARYRDALADHSAPTVRRKLASLSSIYSKALAAKIPTATWNPFHPDALDWPSSSEYVKTPLITDEDAEKIIAVSEVDDSQAGRRDCAILCLLYETGLRRDVVCTLRRANLLIEPDGAMRMRVKIKGDKDVEVTVPKRTAAAIERWLDVSPASPHVFIGNKGAALSASTVNTLMRHRAKQAGVSAEVSPHSFRAAYITAALDAGVPLHEVQASVHHSDPRTTLRYDRRARGGGVADKLAEFRKGKR